MYDGNMGHLRQVVRFVAYCRRHAMSLVVQGGAGAPPAAAEEEAGGGQEGEEMAAGVLWLHQVGPRGQNLVGGRNLQGTTGSYLPLMSMRMVLSWWRWWDQRPLA
jgi:hypothetical protein